MKYNLMHKNVHVLDITLDDSIGTIHTVEEIYNIEHLPIGTFQGKTFNGNDFKHWWIGRSIPASRSGLKDALEILDIPVPTSLISKCMGLSLSDQYWIRPDGSDLKWKDINFFSNEFSEDIGNLLFGYQKHGIDISLNSPDNTSDGILKKRWKIVDGKRCLIKSGGGPSIQEPFNEVIASILMRSQNIPCCDYSLMWDNGRPCSICEDFINTDTEYINASNLIQSYSSKKDGNTFDRYVKSCDDVNVDITDQLDRMIVIDYIMMNTDRHLGNFGLVRNANDLEYIGPAPIFDTGTSLGCSLLTREFKDIKDDRCKPFKRTFEEQLSLVSTFEWVDMDAMYSSMDDIEKVLRTNRFLDDDRVNAITGLLQSRMNSLDRTARDR